MKISMINIALFLACFSTVGLYAQTSNPVTDSSYTSQKIDRMSGKIDDLHQVVVESPLGDRKWGVEIDPFLLLFLGSSQEEGFGGVAGTVSNFSFNRSAELAFPIFYSNARGSYMLNLDAHYRYFLSGRQKGFYLGGFGRFQNAKYKGYYYDDYYGDSTSHTVNREGVGFEIGTRIFSRSGIYWGCSLALGRYVHGETPFSNNLVWLSTGDIIFDVELLKIGFAF